MRAPGPSSRSRKATSFILLAGALLAACGEPDPKPQKEPWIRNEGPFEVQPFTNIKTGPIDEGYIMDIAVRGRTIYALVMSDDPAARQDCIILFDGETGLRLGVWNIGNDHAAAVASSGETLLVVHRSQSGFLKEYDLQGSLSGTWPIEEYPAGKLYGLATDGTRQYFTMEDGASSAIYSFRKETGEATLAHTVPAKVYALTFAAGRLYAYRNGLSVYSESWLLEMDPSTWETAWMSFFPSTSWGLDHDGESFYAMRRLDDGLEAYSFSIEHQGQRVVGQYMARRLSITFPFLESTESPYDLDLFLACPLSWDVQQMRNVTIEPAPTELLIDAYENEWAHLLFEANRGDAEVKLTMDLVVPATVQTLDASYIFDQADVPEEIYGRYTAETYCFDYSHPVVQEALDHLTLAGTYVENLLEIRDYVNDSLAVEGASGPQSRASDFLALGVGRCYAHTLSFAAIARLAGYPVRAMGGIIADVSHAEADPLVHTWNQVYFPHVGWVDLDTVADDDPGGAHTFNHVGYHPSSFFYTFRGAYDLADNLEIFAQRSFYLVYAKHDLDPARPAGVSMGTMRVESFPLEME